MQCLILCGVSILTLTAISMDRLLTLSFGPRYRHGYRHVVTLRRIRIAIICFWLTGVIVALQSIFLDFLISISIALVFVFLCVVISIFSCAKIFRRLRHHQVQVVNHPHQEQPNRARIALNSIVRYKKSVSSIAWVQLALVVCYLSCIICFFCDK